MSEQQSPEHQPEQQRPKEVRPQEWRNEKDEKETGEKQTGEKQTGEKQTGEKEEEKTHEKEEKPRDVAEKWQQDPLSAIVWASVLIVGGFVLILDNLGVPIFDGNGWSIALVCAGLIVGLEAVVRILMPEYRRPVRGTLILAAVLFGLGLSGWIGWGMTWALLIIGAGVAILLTGLRRGR